MARTRQIIGIMIGVFGFIAAIVIYGFTRNLVDTILGGIIAALIIGLYLNYRVRKLNNLAEEMRQNRKNIKPDEHATL